MEALRYIEIPHDGRITIDLPEILRSKEKVEIIVLPYNDIIKKKKAFDPKKFRGAGKLKMTVDEIGRESKKLRNEWNRNF
jgi:hypothetical protein